MATRRNSRAHHASVAGVLLALLLCVGAVRADPALLPHRPWIAGFGSLCDAGPMVCTRIDEIGFNARIDAILLTTTDRRGIGLVAPYGFSFGILEHVEGGIYTHSAIWAQPDGTETHTQFQQGPMRFALKGLLWPWRPHPHQHFSLLLDFEYEARLPRFDGQLRDGHCAHRHQRADCRRFALLGGHTSRRNPDHFGDFLGGEQTAGPLPLVAAGQAIVGAQPRHHLRVEGAAGGPSGDRVR